MLFLLQDLRRYKLGDPRTFHYLNQSSCYEVANVDDAREYLETRNAMDVVGISQEEQVYSDPSKSHGLYQYNYYRQFMIFPLSNIYKLIIVINPSLGCHIPSGCCNPPSWEH